jgi:predicted LPLAT superfamily acyltransferase
MSEVTEKKVGKPVSNLKVEVPLEEEKGKDMSDHEEREESLKGIARRMVLVAHGGNVSDLRAYAVACCPKSKDAARVYQEHMRRLRDAAEAAFQSATEESNLLLLS